MARATAVDYDRALEMLERGLREAETRVVSGAPGAALADLGRHVDAVFESRTQAYREVLLGCFLARIQNRAIDICKPYASQGERAFNGRSLDEKVVNPFLQDHRIPCTKGPYLSVFRRTVPFTEETRQGVRDKEGYDAFLEVLRHVESLTNEAELFELLVHMLACFVQLRDVANVGLTKLQRVSLDQLDALIAGLLDTPSGGRLPVLLGVAGFQTAIDHFGLDWTLDFQEINVADAAAQVSGDITIRQDGQVLLAVEVTERKVDKARVVATFNTKVAAHGIEDYVFLTTTAPDNDVKRQAYRYYAQGHEMNFALVRDWLRTLLTTMGKRGRELFHQKLVALLEGPDIPASLKVAWNKQVEIITTEF